MGYTPVHVSYKVTGTSCTHNWPAAAAARMQKSTNLQKIAHSSCGLYAEDRLSAENCSQQLRPVCRKLGDGRWGGVGVEGGLEVKGVQGVVACLPGQHTQRTIPRSSACFSCSCAGI
eukprot:1149924-Pelagomonas_calceolata.AAC.1